MKNDVTIGLTYGEMMKTQAYKEGYLQALHEIESWAQMSSTNRDFSFEYVTKKFVKENMCFFTELYAENQLYGIFEDSYKECVNNEE